MSLIIDGYNLIHAAGIVGPGMGPGGLERSRVAMLNFVVESIDAADLPKTTIVFDAQGAPPGLPRELVHGGVRVRFATGYDSADELIEELIERESAPRRLIVVSSDHRLHRAARRRKAQAIDSDIWYQQTLARRNERRRSGPPGGQKPPTPLAASEVAFWLSRFAEQSPHERGAAAPDHSEQPDDAADKRDENPTDEIFPQSYLDSIDERELDE